MSRITLKFIYFSALDCNSALFGDISSEDKTLKIYAKLFHEIYNEVEKEEVIDDTLFWIEKHL